MTLWPPMWGIGRTKDLIPNIKNLSNTLGGINALVSSVVNGVVYAVKIVTNTLLGFIVAIYLLVSKTQMIGRAKQLSYSIFSIKVANDILVRCRYIHKVFGGFIRGKLLDSFIIGIICFVGTSLLNIPFAILISVVVGVTNIIPFFRPPHRRHPLCDLGAVLQPHQVHLFCHLRLCSTAV